MKTSRAIRGLTLPLIMVGVATALAACSNGGHNAGQDTPTTIQSSQSTTTGPPSSGEALNYVTSFDLTGTNGYKLHVELDRGALEHALATLHNGWDTLGSSCTLDDQTDAVIPYKMTVTNTTAGFNADEQVKFTMSGGDAFSSTALIDSESVTGPSSAATECDGGDVVNPGACVSPCMPSYAPQLAPGQESVTEGFIIAKKVYSPAHPAGDFTGIENLIFTFLEDGWVLNTSKPVVGALPYTSGNLPVVALDPAATPACAQTELQPC